MRWLVSSLNSEEIGPTNIASVYNATGGWREQTEPHVSVKRGETLGNTVFLDSRYQYSWRANIDIVLSGNRRSNISRDIAH